MDTGDAAAAPPAVPAADAMPAVSAILPSSYAAVVRRVTQLVPSLAAVATDEFVNRLLQCVEDGPAPHPPVVTDADHADAASSSPALPFHLSAAGASSLHYFQASLCCYTFQPDLLLLLRTRWLEVAASEEAAAAAATAVGEADTAAGVGAAARRAQARAERMQRRQQAQAAACAASAVVAAGGSAAASDAAAASAAAAVPAFALSRKRRLGLHSSPVSASAVRMALSTSGALQSHGAAAATAGLGLELEGDAITQALGPENPLKLADSAYLRTTPHTLLALSHTAATATAAAGGGGGGYTLAACSFAEQAVACMPPSSR